MQFSPAYISALFVWPLRFLFELYAPDELKWTDDPKTSGIEIDTINNFNKRAIQAKPRILFSRGQYTVSPVGLSDNLAEAPSFWDTRGTSQRTNMLLINGVAQILIEARNEGTCEKVLDLTQHFLAWTGPLIAGTQGFKGSFLPMAVSPCTPTKEDTEVFAATINIPWSKEEHWTVKGGDEVKIKQFLLDMTAPPPPTP